MPDGSLTVGRLARAAEVGIETVRYYQQRKLLPVPEAHGAFRHYNADAVDRIRFIKRAQELGFSLAEIGELLKLQEALIAGRFAASVGATDENRSQAGHLEAHAAGAEASGG